MVVYGWLYGYGYERMDVRRALFMVGWRGPRDGGSVVFGREYGATFETARAGGRCGAIPGGGGGQF